MIVPCVSGDWVYFRHNDEADGLWRISIDGGEPQQVLGVRLQSYCIMDDWIYYADLDEPFCVRRVRTDGTGYEFFYPCEMAFITLNGADGILYLPYNAICEDGVVTGRNLLVLDTATLTRLYETEMEMGSVWVGSGGLCFMRYSEGFAWYTMEPSGSTDKVG